jgi:hypothetical protein
MSAKTAPDVPAPADAAGAAGTVAPPSAVAETAASAGDGNEASRGPVPSGLEDARSQPTPAAAVPPASEPLDAERIRLWTDTKDWMDAICKRLNLSLQDVAARANVKDAATFQQWFDTGKPQKVTRQLRVWVKDLVDEAKVLQP